MKQVNLPIPTGWRLFCREIYRRIHQQVTSPWTKLVVLGALVLIISQKELSFSLSINGGNLFSINEASVFTQPTDGPEISTLGAAAGACTCVGKGITSFR